MSVVDAIQRLQAGDVVAIPTETVYGLAADITQVAALKKIFSTKERPFFDPLIVHVDSIDKARALTDEWTPLHEALAQAAWPGPLTLLARRNDRIDPLITSGLSEVALRCPRHPLALEILAAFEGLAAPSANRFGKTSPTTAAHVRAEFEQVLVVDGGPCEVGIESTVVHIADEHRLIIYRPGYYTAQMLEQILKRAGFEVQVTYQESPVAPGHLKHHYMPDIPVLVGHKKSTAEVLKAAEESLQRKFTNAIEIYLGEDAILAARKFYQELRDKTPGHDAIVIRTSPVHLREEWKGLMNRLEKAASFRC